MKLYTSIISLFFLVAASAFGANDKYRLIITDDPSTTMTIGWNQISGHSVAVFFDVVDHGQDVQQYANFQLPDRTVVFKDMNNYFVRLSNLSPATKYYFVIVDNEGVSQRFWFETLPDDPNVPLSVIAGGDSRRSGTETSPHEPRIQSNKVVRAVRPHFVAFGGDYTDRDTDGQWKAWFDDWQYTTGEDGRMTPIYAARGNHERSNEIVTNLFDVRMPDVYYAINFGGSLIRFYTLNSMASVAGDQTNWLAQDLMQNDSATAWKMAHYHYTIAPHTASKPYRIGQYTHWAPLFYQHGLQLIIECDTHMAKNSWPVKPSDENGSEVGFIRDDETGTVYTGEGSWGLVRPANVEYNWTRDKGSFTQVKWMHVTMDSVVVYTIKSATSNTDVSVDDNDRFKMPEGFDIWITENGNRILIDRPNPLYQPQQVTSTNDIERLQVKLIKKLYPNPSNNIINVQLQEPVTHSYRVFDIKGRVVKEGQMKNTLNALDINNLMVGNYYLKVWKKGSTAFQVESFVKN
ncbi:MAG: T9SS type A sorting domain-containing protein [Bacteroidota bacterium]